jgi:hypothetical protein
VLLLGFAMGALFWATIGERVLLPALAAVNRRLAGNGG